MNTNHLTSNRPKQGPLRNASRIVLAAGLALLTFSGVSSAWAEERLSLHAAPIHLAGLSLHIGPGGGIQIGIGGHRHGYRGTYGHSRKHFGHRHKFKRSRHIYRHFDRHNHGSRFYGRHHNQRGHYKGGRHHRRHRH